MINIVEDMLAKHSDAEIIEYLYRQMQVVEKYHDSVVVRGMDINILLSQSDTVALVTDILRALYKRNQERQAQANMI